MKTAIGLFLIAFLWQSDLVAQVKPEYPVESPGKQQTRTEEQSLSPRGKGNIDKNWLRYNRPSRPSRPTISTRRSAEINVDTAAMIAVARAKQLWGGNPIVGSVMPINNLLGELVAYDIDLKMDGTKWEDYENIATDWQKILIEEENVVRVKPTTKDEKVGKIDAKTGKPKHAYASLTISATLDVYPVRSARRGVSNFYASGWVTNEIAKSVSGGNPQLVEVFLLGAWERSYRFDINGTQIVVEGQEPWSWYAYQDYYNAGKVGAESRKRIVQEMVAKAGMTMEFLLDSIKIENRKAIQKILSNPNSLLNDIFIPGYNTLFERFEWHYGCSPTAGAMVLNYWDIVSWYGKLNFWYFKEYDNIEGDWDCHVARLQLQLKNTMGTDDNGLTTPSNIYPGMKNYANAQGYNFSGGSNWTGSVLGWHWNDMINDINDGYPFAWTLDWYPNAGSRHTVAAVGYDDVNNDIFCYNTWRTSGNSVQRAHYSGGVLDFSFGASPRRGGAILYDAKLTSHDGYQTFGACGYSGTVVGDSSSTITWDNFNRPGDHVTLFYSTNSGINWRLIGSGSDSGSYAWTVPSVNTTQARILIQQYSTSTTFVSSDGSYGDFRIQTVTDVAETTNGVPAYFALLPNFPNPFNPSTTIRYNVAHRSGVKLHIFNTLGQRVATLVNEQKEPGRYEAVWDGRNGAGQQVGSGVYFYRLRAGEFVQTKKLMLLR